MGKDYYDRIRATLEKFCRPEDQLRCIDNYDHPYLICQMCGHPCIRDIFVLANQRTGQTLLVGCRCIVEYRRVHEQIGQKVKPVLFPPALRVQADKVNKQYAGTAAIEVDQAEMDRQATEAYRELREDIEEEELMERRRKWEELLGMGLDPDDPDYEELAPH